MTKLRTHLLGVAASAALVMGFGSYAQADAPLFTFDPSSLNNAGIGPFVANNLLGNSTELLVLNPNQGGPGVAGASGSGILQFSNFACNASAASCTSGVGNLNSTTTGLNFGPILGFHGYASYVTFSLTDILTGGTLGAVGSTYALTSLTFQWYIDPQQDDVLTDASSAGPIPASLTNTGNDILIADGSLLYGTAGLTTNNGATLNSTESFNLCNGSGTALDGGMTVADTNCVSGLGASLFTLPRPFFTLVLDGFNNAGGGVTVNAPFVSVNDAVGTVDFTAMPEPGSLALFGTALLSLGWIVRRRRQTS